MQVRVEEPIGDVVAIRRIVGRDHRLRSKRRDAVTGRVEPHRHRLGAVEPALHLGPLGGAGGSVDQEDGQHQDEGQQSATVPAHNGAILPARGAQRDPLRKAAPVAAPVKKNS